MIPATPSVYALFRGWLNIAGSADRRWLRAFWGCLVTLGCLAGEPVAFPVFKPESAREYLQSVLQDTQAHVDGAPETCFLLARIRNQLGEKQEAEQLAKRALEAGSNRTEVQLFLAEMYIHQDRLDEAAGVLRQAIEAKPGVPGGSRQLGMVLDRLGDRNGARKAFEDAIRTSSTDATSRLLLGRLLLDQGQAREAATWLKKACELEPQLGGAFYALAQAQEQLGETEAARESRQKFQELKAQERKDYDTNNATYDDGQTLRLLAASFHTGMAGMCQRQKKPDRAEAHLRQAIRVAPQESHAQEMLASLLIQSGRLAEARGVYEDLVRLKPDQVAYRLTLSTLLLQMQDATAAAAQWRRVLELDPLHVEAMQNLTRLLLSTQRNPPEALALAQRLVELQPTGASYDLLGWASYANGRKAEAIAAASRAVELDPNNRTYRERLQKLKSAP